jgi:NADH:ubiquinone oxidoreductase subunit H
LPAGGASWLNGGLGFIGAHISFLGAGIGLLFLQRYIWLLGLAARGYGPYQTASYLISLSAAVILFDLVVLRWALKRSRTARILSLVWPALFLGMTLFVLVANNA